MNEPKPCTECGVIHAKPNEHKFIYIDLDDTLNKRGLVDPITLHMDAKSAIALAKNPMHHKRSKHIDIKYH